MNVTYQLTIEKQCPTDPKVMDSYEVTVASQRMIKVEDIIGFIDKATGPWFQEELTDHIARNLQCHVTTVGIHSGVKTTCTA